MNQYDEKESMIEKTPLFSAEDIIKVACFIGWHEDNYLYGGTYSNEAFDAFCRLIRVDRDLLYKIVRGNA